MTRRQVLLAGALCVPASAALAHDPTRRERKGPHGGVLAELGWGFVEVTATTSGEFRVFVLNWRSKPRSLEGWKGNISPGIEGYEAVELSTAGEALAGAGAAITRSTFTSRLSLVEPSGRVRNVTVELHL